MVFFDKIKRMKLFLICFFVIIVSVFFEKPCHSRPTSLSILGNPASGKTFYYKKFLKEKLNKEHTKLLTIDLIRDEFLKAPTIVKLYETFHTFDSIQSFIQEDPKKNSEWLNDYKKTLERILKEILNIYKGKNKISILIKDNAFLFKKEGVEFYNVFSFLKDIEPYSVEIHKKIFLKGPYYERIKRVTRIIQYMAFNKAILEKKNILLDETGEEVFKLINRLKILKKGGYKNIVFMFYPKTTLISYMNNAFRMIEGSEGGRDSSLSIGRSHRKITQEIKKENNQYQKNSGTFNRIDLSSSLGKFNEISEKIFLEINKNTLPPSDKIIDYFLWIDISDPEEVSEQINTTLTNLNLDPILWKALVKLHIDNKKKTTAEEKEQIQKLPLFKLFCSLSKQEAFYKIKKSIEGGRYKGLTWEVLEEAKNVWGDEIRKEKNIFQFLYEKIASFKSLFARA